MLGSRQEPTTTLRGRRIRETMNPNSRSPWADWFRFMKSMSMVVHGSSSLNCVCRWRWGFASDRRPAIHIRAGENVCIQLISPMQLRELLASQHKRSMDSPVVTTGLATIFTGIDGDSDSAAPMARECCSTALRVSWPYRCWLPVTNQTSSPEKSIILLPRPSTAPACGDSREGGNSTIESKHSQGFRARASLCTRGIVQHPATLGPEFPANEPLLLARPILSKHRALHPHLMEL